MTVKFLREVMFIFIRFREMLQCRRHREKTDQTPDGRLRPSSTARRKRKRGTHSNFRRSPLSHHGRRK